MDLGRRSWVCGSAAFLGRADVLSWAWIEFLSRILLLFFTRSIWASQFRPPSLSASGSAAEAARSQLDLGRLRELGAGAAGVPVPAPRPPVDAVSACSLSPVGPGPSGGSRFAGL